MKTYKILMMAIALVSCLTVTNILFLNVSLADDSAIEEKISRSLIDGRLVFLCFYPVSKELLLKTVKSEISGIDLFFKGAASIFYMNSNDISGRSYFRKFSVPDKKAVVYTIRPDGRIISRLEGDQITRKKFAETFYGYLLHWI